MRRRFVVAFAASIFLHEIVAGALNRPQQAAHEERVVTQVVTIVKRVPTPTPMPKPTAVPTPIVTPAPHYSIAPHVVVRAPAARAAATPARKLGGAAAPKHVVARPRVSASPVSPVSVADNTRAGRQNGGSGTGGGAGAGTGGLGGTGSGNGISGNGNGGDANAAPCGQIYLLPGPLSYRKDGAALQEVVAKLILRDGTVEVGTFPYPFVYSGEGQNPFRHDVGLAKNGGIPVQLPPPGTDLATLPDSVQVVLKHTNPSTGATDLPECVAPKATG